MDHVHVVLVFYGLGIFLVTLSNYLCWIKIGSLRDELTARIHDEENTRMAKCWELDSRLRRLLDHLNLIDVKLPAKSVIKPLKGEPEQP